jgi:hypothetical protein
MLELHEQIHITVFPFFSSCSRSKKRERLYAKPLKLRPMLAQQSNDLVTTPTAMFHC